MISTSTWISAPETRQRFTISRICARKIFSNPILTPVSLFRLVTMRKLLVSGLVAIAGCWAGDSVHVTGYHLTAHPWKPLNIGRDRYLDAIEGVCRFSVRHQDASGAI